MVYNHLVTNNKRERNCNLRDKMGLLSKFTMKVTAKKASFKILDGFNPRCQRKKTGKHLKDLCLVDTIFSLNFLYVFL